MKYQCVRILKFDAGHRVVKHESKCRTLHGHEYKAHIYAEADQLDNLGRVIDFGKIKELVGTWIDENWDHNMILFNEDPDLEKLQSCDGAKAPYVVPFNPTAENLANYLLGVCNDLLSGHNIVVEKIRLWETSNCYVEVQRGKESKDQ